MQNVLICFGFLWTVFKMDRYGNGEELLLDKVFDSMTGTPSFRSFDKELFIGMCVLAGCDFLSSVPGIGIAKAYSMVSKYRNMERKLNGSHLDQGESISNQVSVVIEKEDSNSEKAMDSQDSVNSKPKRVSKGKERKTIEKKKTSNCKISVNKNTSILNLFSCNLLILLLVSE
ncbi:hypothetical protein QYF36_006639 [Acer negundo]|nr:hypothetical protein QYF36_006639 [Acer negundo]